MPYGLYISAEGAQAQSKRLEVIANNLANVDTVGFKKQLALAQARFAEAIERGRVSPGAGTLDDIGGGVTIRDTPTDFAHGPLKSTGTVTDVALRGEGFFAVKKGEQTLLTRAGNFRVNERGELQTQDGYSVLNDGGSPVVIPRPTEPWDVSSNGEIRQGGDVQRLAILQPKSLGDLVRQGENLFRPLSDPEPLPAKQRDVVGGHLEMSGVHPTTEMVELIESTRSLEANLSMVQTQDQMLNGLFNKLLRTS